MRRGAIWTVSGGAKYTGKPRPAVIVQEDRFDGTDSITVCAFTGDPTNAPLFRLAVEPSSANGLKQSSRLTVDKVTTVPKARLGKRLGQLENEDLALLNGQPCTGWTASVTTPLEADGATR